MRQGNWYNNYRSSCPLSYTRTHFKIYHRTSQYTLLYINKHNASFCVHVCVSRTIAELRIFIFYYYCCNYDIIVFYSLLKFHWITIMLFYCRSSSSSWCLTFTSSRSSPHVLFRTFSTIFVCFLFVPSLLFSWTFI